MCLSSELCELSTLPQILQAFDVVDVTVTRLCDRMCFVKSWLLGNSSSQMGHVNVSLPSSPAVGNIYMRCRKTVTDPVSGTAATSLFAKSPAET